MPGEDFTAGEIAVINERRWGWEKASCTDLARIFNTTPQKIAAITSPGRTEQASDVRNGRAGHKLRVLSLFAGIGGFDLGLERTGGFETVAFCEIDTEAQAVLRKHWPRVPIYDDVRELTAERLRADGIEPDCIVGGFPCQDISLAGSGAGLSGERSGLWRYYRKLIGEIRPRFVIVENVAALLGRGLGAVLGDLAALGYNAEWHCIPASYVGARQLRDRIWIVAYPQRDVVQGGATVTAAWCEKSREEQLAGLVQPCTWPTVPGARNCGTGHGIPRGVHRNKQLGNAVVPQIPELIGRAILSAFDNRAGNPCLPMTGATCPGAGHDNASAFQPAPGFSSQHQSHGDGV